MIVVSGATGFIGRRVMAALAAAGHPARALVRETSYGLPPAVAQVVTGDLATFRDWSQALEGAQCVLHLAGLAHVENAAGVDREAQFRRANVDVTSAFARAAVSAGIKRFVFVSSIGVNGQFTTDAPFTDRDAAAPVEPYARAKYEAESCLRSICTPAGTELVIVRPTVVAGQGAPGNLRRIARLIRRGMPVPACGSARRHLVGARSLAELLRLCCIHPAAPGHVFLAADDPPLSVTEIARHIALGMGVRSRIVEIPESLLRGVGILLRRSRDVSRLCQPLLVDAEPARQILSWMPPHSIQEELQQTGRHDTAVGRTT